MSELAMTLSALRRAAGISQARMAAELSLSPAEISAVEHGTRVFIRPKFVSDWAVVCGADDQEARLLELWERAGAAGGGL